jgi:hypothetical protein
VRVCGHRGCVRTGAREVLGEKPKGFGRDANATLQPRRRVATHGKAVAGAWRGWGVAGPRGVGGHARARVLASQGRGVAMPCAGHRHPGPVTRRGGGRQRRLWARRGGATGSCTKGGTAVGWGEGVLRLATEGSSAAPAARGGKGKERRR